MKSVIAIVGRPNVGKSALFNLIIGRRISIVHEQSGVTRDRVTAAGHFRGKHFMLVDTGGMGVGRREQKHVDIFDGLVRDQVSAIVSEADPTKEGQLTVLYGPGLIVVPELYLFHFKI